MEAGIQNFQGQPLIDDDKLQSIKDLAEPNDADGFFRDLLNLFFERVPQLIDEIAQGFKDADALRMERSAHALKGTSGNLGAMQIMHLAEHLETLGRQKILAGASTLIEQLTKVYPLTRSELEKHSHF